MIVFGTGSGGCGLADLSRLLAGVHGSAVTKERWLLHTPWSGGLWAELGLLSQCRADLDSGATLAGDVAPYHLPYCWELARRCPEARFIVLERDRESVAKYLVAGMGGSHTMLDHSGHPWRHNPAQHTWPCYGMGDRMEAARLHWDVCHRMARQLRNEIPGRFEIFPTATLDTPQGRNRIIDFACGNP